MLKLNQAVTPTQITHLHRLWLYGLAALILLFLILPCLIVIPMSFSASQYLEFPPREWSLRWYEAYLTSPEWMLATWVSFKVAIISTLVATVLGTMAAYGLSQARGGMAKFANGLMMLPMLVPIILVAVGVFFVYSRTGLNNTVIGLVLAHSVLAIPFVLIAVGNGLQGFDMNQEMAARSLGASRAWAFLTVTLPQIRLSIISGALFAFIASFDEVVIALFIVGGDSSTLTRRMFANIRDQIDPTVAAVSTLMILLSILLLVLMQYIKGMEKRRQRVPSVG
ncbi:ABC transporter permease [Pseudomonas hunanensis]|uniref:ABC transporter permease n=1 Tax=Pseudomonas hunanensis TaxID=1247546 RepID=A0ABD6N535_9PSED|nr:ABC transporter permease [Pseudomonas hunanensis]NWL47440.1 ABC transporter permease [Pseudomonas hunanensis]